MTELNVSGGGMITGNGLRGRIPAELGSLADLQRLYLSGNRLTGCIPTGLRNVPVNDLDNLGLPFCDDADKAALVALYNAADGPNWVFNTNWLSDRPLGEWYGVTTVATGRVTALRLYTINGDEPIGVSGGGVVTGNGLRGRIPADLGSLSNLESLYLSSSQLSGDIPPELGNLTNLKWLSLYDQQLSGEIPAELGNLSNLRGLDLVSNQLSGEIPPELPPHRMAAAGGQPVEWEYPTRNGRPRQPRIAMAIQQPVER